MIGLVVSGIKTLLGWGREKAKASHEREMAEIELQTRLLLDTQKANSQWEIAQLNDKDKWIRYGAFLIFSSPVIAYWISPEFGHRISSGLQQISSRNLDMLDTICLAVFGIKKIPEFLGATIGAVKDGLRKK